MIFQNIDLKRKTNILQTILLSNPTYCIPGKYHGFKYPLCHRIDNGDGVGHVGWTLIVLQNEKDNYRHYSVSRNDNKCNYTHMLSESKLSAYVVYILYCQFDFQK